MKVNFCREIGSLQKKKRKKNYLRRKKMLPFKLFLLALIIGASSALGILFS